MDTKVKMTARTAELFHAIERRDGCTTPTREIQRNHTMLIEKLHRKHNFKQQQNQTPLPIINYKTIPVNGDRIKVIVGIFMLRI